MPSTDSITPTPLARPAAGDRPVAKAGKQSRAVARAHARTRGKKFLSYYRPYRGLFLVDMACALIVSAITLLIPLCARHVTTAILVGNVSQAPGQIYLMGALMLALVGVHTLCTMFTYTRQ